MSPITPRRLLPSTPLCELNVHDNDHRRSKRQKTRKSLFLGNGKENIPLHLLPPATTKRFTTGLRRAGFAFKAGTRGPLNRVDYASDVSTSSGSSDAQTTTDFTASTDMVDVLNY